MFVKDDLKDLVGRVQMAVSCFVGENCWIEMRHSGSKNTSLLSDAVTKVVLLVIHWSSN